jgi:hypothetical protein
MKKNTFTFLILAILAALALSWAAAPPALAYFAPLQDVTFPSVTQDSNTRVTVSVHNPATGQDIPYTWTIDGGSGAIAIDQITKSQGMVAWRVKDLANNKFKIVWGTYDPGWAALQSNPELGWMFYETWVWIDHDTNIIALNDGVLQFETKYTTGGLTNIIDYFEAYDPSGWYEAPGPGPGPPPGWMPYGWREYTASFSNFPPTATTRNHLVKDGVAAFIFDSPNWGIGITYALYDGKAHNWQITFDEFTTNPTALQITNATVTWTDGTVNQKRGYDYTTTSWISNANTKVMAYFDFWPTPVKVGKWVYFTDMSIGATTWNYNLGDTTSTTTRSFYHKYLGAGNYAVNQQVTGPAGNDANTRTVPVKASASTAPLMLLLMDG